MHLLRFFVCFFGDVQKSIVAPSPWTALMTKSWKFRVYETAILTLSMERVEFEPVWGFPKNKGTPKWMVYNGTPY